MLLFRSLLAPVLGSDDPEARRRGLWRWFTALAVLELVVLAACAAYVVPLAPSHRHQLAWLLPPLGAVFGTALPLQFIVARIARSALRPPE